MTKIYDQASWKNIGVIMKGSQIHENIQGRTISTSNPSLIFNAWVHQSLALHNNRMQSDKIGRCAPNFAADARR
jgi:hypothetical protein